jgi:hypothetical protein
VGAHRRATGAQRADVRGGYRRAGAPRRVVAAHPRQFFWGIKAAPRRGDGCPCGSIFGVAVCTHRDCSWGRRRAVTGGAHRERPPPSCALIVGWRRAVRAIFRGRPSEILFGGATCTHRDYSSAPVGAALGAGVRRP